MSRTGSEHDNGSELRFRLNRRPAPADKISVAVDGEGIVNAEAAERLALRCLEQNGVAPSEALRFGNWSKWSGL